MFSFGALVSIRDSARVTKVRPAHPSEFLFHTALDRGTFMPSLTVEVQVTDWP
jgi:hypothetical protein